MPHRDLRLFEATERIVDQVNALLDGPLGGRMLYVVQLRDAVESINANVSEGFGRGEGRDRMYRLRIARGEAEETIKHLGANYRSKRIPQKRYWPTHNLLVVIVKMIDSLLVTLR